MICCVLAMEILQGVWKQHLRPQAVVGYGVKFFFSKSSKLRHQITWKVEDLVAEEIAVRVDGEVKVTLKFVMKN